MLGLHIHDAELAKLHHHPPLLRQDVRRVLAVQQEADLRPAVAGRQSQGQEDAWQEEKSASHLVTISYHDLCQHRGSGILIPAGRHVDAFDTPCRISVH